MLAPLSLWLGHKARRETQSSDGEVGAAGIATAAIVLSWIDIALAVQFVGFIAVLIAVGAASA